MYCSTNRRCKYVIASVCAFTRRPCYSFRVFTRFISLSLSLLASSCKIVKRAQLLAIDYTCEYQILADDKKGREPAAAPLASFLVSSFFFVCKFTWKIRCSWATFTPSARLAAAAAASKAVLAPLGVVGWSIPGNQTSFIILHYRYRISDLIWIESVPASLFLSSTN